MQQCNHVVAAPNPNKAAGWIVAEWVAESFAAEPAIDICNYVYRRAQENFDVTLLPTAGLCDNGINPDLLFKHDRYLVICPEKHPSSLDRYVVIGWEGERIIEIGRQSSLRRHLKVELPSWFSSRPNSILAVRHAQVPSELFPPSDPRFAQYISGTDLLLRVSGADSSVPRPDQLYRAPRSG